VLAHAGLRPGEAYALQWPDIDFANRRIRVERACSAGRVETPKTGGGRTVDMSAHVVRTLWSSAREAKRAEAEEPFGRYAAVDLLHRGGNAAR
jgi:integrase